MVFFGKETQRRVVFGYVVFLCFDLDGDFPWFDLVLLQKG